MKAQMLLPVVAVVTVALFGFIQLGKRDRGKQDRRLRFQDIKLRVTHDLLQEFHRDSSERAMQLEQTLSKQKALEEEVKELQVKAEKAKAEVDGCQGNKKFSVNEVLSEELALSNLKDQKDKETAKWNTEMATLNLQLATRSTVCDFLKGGDQKIITLCATGAKQEEPKVDAPKLDEPKVDAPKPEEPKVEAPQPEVPKVDAPKPEEPKVEAPQPEVPKVDAPKPEEPKVEAPQPEVPKVDAPKPEEPKVDAPKPEEPKTLKKR